MNGTPFAQTDINFVTFDTCYPSFCSHWVTHTIKIIAPLLLADTVCHTSHSLLLLVQLSKLVTTAHEQTAIARSVCLKHNFCQFERRLTSRALVWISMSINVKIAERCCRTPPEQWQG